MRLGDFVRLVVAVFNALLPWVVLALGVGGQRPPERIPTGLVIMNSIVFWCRGPVGSWLGVGVAIKVSSGNRSG
jgi:hypothetical protein